MKKVLVLLLPLALIFSCNTKKDPKNQNPETDYSKIAEGLLPAVVIGDSSAQTYSVKYAMEKYNVPGVSIAVFKNGKTVWTHQYGTHAADSNDSIGADTKFQAASIGKAITALGVLKLVENYDIGLDADVNTYLKSWKAESEFTKTEKVTIRQLLNHTSGANVAGFHGYSQEKPTLSLSEIMNGKGNSPKVVIDTIPGAIFSYSGGGFSILQLLVQDVTGKPFENYFQEEVFIPLKMDNSTFSQEPKENIALGHDESGQPHPEGYLIFPELAAAGLWSTPTELIKFCIAIGDSYEGKDNSIISHDLANQMLTVTKGWGLNIGVRGESDDAYFFHAGGNPGSYKSLMVNLYNQNSGIAIMTNAEQGSQLQDDILRSFSRFFNNSVFEAEYITPYELSSNQMNVLKGKYQLESMNNYFLEIISEEPNRITLHDQTME